MKHIMICFKNTKGAGALAIIVLLFLGIIGAAFTTLSNSSLLTASRTRDDIGAQYLAEAGAQWAIAQIKANANYTTANTSSTSVNPGSYLVRVENVSSTKKIVSTGTINGSSRTVVLIVTPPSSGGNKMFNSTVYSIGNMRITNPKIYGDVGTNGYLEITTSVPDTVTGSAYSSTSLYYSSAVVTKGFKPVTEPASLDVDSMMPNLTMTGTNLTSTWTSGQWGNYTYPLSSGAYYYNGNYDLNGHSYSISAGQNVTIYVNGTFTLMSGSKINVNGGTLTVYATGGVNFNGGSIVGTNGAVSKVYARGAVNLSNNSSISGACLITALDNVGINGIAASNTVIISKTYVKGSSGSTVAGIYSAGTIEMVGATATYNSATNAALGLAAGTSTPLTVNSYNDHI